MVRTTAQVATKLGGGGHKYASGAQYKSPFFNPGRGVETFINTLKAYLNVDRLEVLELARDSVRIITY